VDEIWGLLLRIVLFYIYILVAIRLSGKRSIGQISPHDFITGLLIGDLFDDIFWGDQPFASGLVAASVLILMHLIFALLGLVNRRLDRQVLGTFPVVLIKDGKLAWEGLRRERTSEDEINSQMRLQDQEAIEEIKQAAWEPSGQMSLLLKHEARPVQKSELDQVIKGLK